MFPSLSLIIMSIQPILHTITSKIKHRQSFKNSKILWFLISQFAKLLSLEYDILLITIKMMLKLVNRGWTQFSTSVTRFFHLDIFFTLNRENSFSFLFNNVYNDNDNIIIHYFKYVPDTIQDISVKKTALRRLLFWGQGG